MVMTATAATASAPTANQGCVIYPAVATNNSNVAGYAPVQFMLSRQVRLGGVAVTLLGPASVTCHLSPVICHHLSMSPCLVLHLHYRTSIVCKWASPQQMFQPVLYSHAYAIYSVLFAAVPCNVDYC